MQDWVSARRSPRGVVLACALVATVAGAAVGAGGAVVDDRSVRTLTLRTGQSLGIAVTVGTIRVTGETGRQDIRLEVVRRAPTAEALARLPIDLADTADGPRLMLAQIGGGADAALRTDVLVTAPADAVLDLLTIADGRLELRGFHGRVRATVARGAIAADDVSGVLRLETTLGPVDVTRARLAGGGLFRLRSFNGDVRLTMAAPLADTRVMALALNGTITSAVPLTMKDGWGPRWAEATIGRPDRVVSIDVVTGMVRIEAPAP